MDEEIRGYIIVVIALWVLLASLLGMIWLRDWSMEQTDIAIKKAFNIQEPVQGQINGSTGKQKYSDEMVVINDSSP